MKSDCVAKCVTDKWWEFLMFLRQYCKMISCQIIILFIYKNKYTQAIHILLVYIHDTIIFVKFVGIYFR